MKNGKSIVITIEPQNGGHLIPRASKERAGHANYSVKRDWRREFDVEVRREGHDYFYPLSNLPIGNQPYPQNQPSQPLVSLPITLLHEVRHPNGDLAVIAGTETDLYTMFPYKNMMPYFEPGATPNDDYVIPPWVRDGDNPTGWTDPNNLIDSGGYSYDGGINPNNGPVVVPPPTDDPPNTPTPDPNTLTPPYGVKEIPNGQPEIVIPDGCTPDMMITVDAGYYFYTTLDDEGNQVILVDNIGYHNLQCLTTLLVKTLAEYIKRYKDAGYNVLPGDVTWWWTGPMIRPYSATYKIANDPTLTPGNGVGDFNMGGSEPAWVGTLMTYFFAIPPV